jgi:murein L,D-transpeptidase YcbB/YkuD
MIARRPTRALLLVAVPVTLISGAWLFEQRSSAGRSSPITALTSASSTASPASAPLWTSSQLDDLLEVIQQAEAEGLRTSDYNIDELRATAGEKQIGARVSALASTSALALAHDFAAGRIRNRHRFNWYIDYVGSSPANLAVSLLAARTQGKLKDWLRGLLPTSSAYHALRKALAATPLSDTEYRAKIRANMERWRWLPRDFERADQLYVNLPTYRLDVVQSGRTTASYRAVIGATDMPTPALSVAVTQIIANPDWIVPASIVRRSHLRPGASSRYIFSTRPDGTMRVRQKPGPGNALGRVKIVFPNPLAIYFHDTPAKALFGANARAFSHGCIRVQNIAALAASLVAKPGQFDAALSGTETRSFSPAQTWRANIVYLTMVPDEAGVLADVGDPYQLDAPLVAALDGTKPPTRRLAPAPIATLHKAAPPTLPMPKPTFSDDASSVPATTTLDETVPGAAENSTPPAPLNNN